MVYHPTIAVKGDAFGPPLPCSSLRDMQTCYIASAGGQRRREKINFCLKAIFISRVSE